MRDEVGTWQPILSTDVPLENIFMRAHMHHHVLWLFAAIFLRRQARYQFLAATIDFRTARQSSRVRHRASSSDARFSHVCSSGPSSVSDVSSCVCSMTLLVHVGNLLVHVAPTNLLVQALHCALQLCCVAVLRFCETETVFLCFSFGLPRRTRHFLLAYGHTDLPTATMLNHGRSRQDTTSTMLKPGMKLLSSVQCKPLPPPPIAAHLRLQPPRCRGYAH